MLCMCSEHRHGVLRAYPHASLHSLDAIKRCLPGSPEERRHSHVPGHRLHASCLTASCGRRRHTVKVREARACDVMSIE